MSYLQINESYVNIYKLALTTRYAHRSERRLQLVTVIGWDLCFWSEANDARALNFLFHATGVVWLGNVAYSGPPPLSMFDFIYMYDIQFFKSKPVSDHKFYFLIICREMKIQLIKRIHSVS